MWRQTRIDCELKNVRDVFVANGFDRKKVQEYMKERKRNESKDERKENECRGTMVVSYVRGLSEQFRRLAAKHSFRTAFESGTKIKEIRRRAQEPLGEKQKSVIYEIGCKCENAVYVGETSR